MKSRTDGCVRKGRNSMVDFSKKNKKGIRIIAGLICFLLVGGMVIALLV